jgi:hypothetical protein
MAVTVQMQFESAVTEMYQDAFVGSSIENGATIITFDLRQRDLPHELGAPSTLFWRKEAYHSVFKFFQVDITGVVRMTSCARYFKEGVGSSRPNWRWIMCFLERPKVNTSCNACVKHLSFS